MLIYFETYQTFLILTFLLTIYFIPWDLFQKLWQILNIRCSQMCQLGKTDLFAKTHFCSFQEKIWLAFVLCDLCIVSLKWNTTFSFPYIKMWFQIWKKPQFFVTKETGILMKQKIYCTAATKWSFLALH